MLMTPSLATAAYIGATILFILSLGGLSPVHRDFVGGFLAPAFLDLRDRLGEDAPEVFLILGNDDARAEEASVLEAATRGAWRYAHARRLPFGPYEVFGYSFVPPTPFLLKDWERYDVSRFIDPGCVSPEEGRRTVPVADGEARYATIREDLERLFREREPLYREFAAHVVDATGTPEEVAERTRQELLRWSG